MARVPTYDRSIGSCRRGELWCDPDQDFPEVWTGRGRWTGGALHTFVDDYRQEFFWRRPMEGLAVGLAAGVMTAPDFTVWTDDPYQWGLYQAWRSATVAAFLQRHGVVVVPVVSGYMSGCGFVRAGSVWAVRGGTSDSWRRYVGRFLENAKAARLLVFGRPLGFDPGIPVDHYKLHSRRGDAAQKEGQ